MAETIVSRGQILASVIVFALAVAPAGTAVGMGTMAMSSSTAADHATTAQAGTTDLGAATTGSVSSMAATSDQVEFVSAEAEASTSNDYEVDRPDGVQEGDLLVMTIGGTDGEPLSQADDGWTRIDICGQDNNADTDCPEDGEDLYLQMFYKVASSDEPSEYDVDARHNTVTSVMALRGANTDDPIESVTALPLDDSEDVSTCPSTEGVDGGMLLCGFTHDDRHELTNYGDLTLRTEDFNGDSSTQVATKQLNDGGDTDVHTPDHVDPTGNKDINMAVVVRPGSSDGGDDGGSDDGSDDGSSGGSKTIDEGTYHIVNENSGMLMEVNEGTDNGQTLLQDPEDGGENQDWQVDHLGDGEYRLIAQHSDKVADVEGASASDNADIHQWGWHGGDNQRWYIDDLGGGEYQIRSVNSDKVVEVADGQDGEDANVHQDAEDGGANQRWTFESADGSDDGGSDDGGSDDGGSDTDGEGVHAIDGSTVEADFQPDFDVQWSNYVYFSYRLNDGQWQYKLMDEVSDNHFETTLGGLSDGDTIAYSFSYYEGGWQYTGSDTYTFQSGGGDDGGSDGGASGPGTNSLVYGDDNELTSGEYLESATGDYRLYFQGSDGNLVLRETSTGDAKWASGTAGDGGTHVKIQGDGNLVMYTDASDAVWASHTAGSGADELVLEDDGALVLYDGGSRVWSVND